MKKLLCLMCVLALCATASARLFVGGDEEGGDFDASDAITATATHWETEGWPDEPNQLRTHPIRTIDGSGLDETGEEHEGVSYTTLPGMHWMGERHDKGIKSGATDTGGNWIMYEFDQSYQLGDLRVWNIAHETARGFRNTVIEHSMDGVAWTRLGGAEATFEFPESSGGGDTGNIVADFGGVQAQWVVLTTASAEPGVGNWGGGNAGLSEVRFYFGGQIVCDPGDADRDGDVDDDDLSLLLANWGSENATCQKGEFSGQAPVDDDDLSLLLANWTGAAGAVPEPATIGLIALGGVALLRRKR